MNKLGLLFYWGNIPLMNQPSLKCAIEIKDDICDLECDAKQ